MLSALLLCLTQPALAQLTQQAKLFGSSAVGAAQQGHAVALSADGNTAVVGGPDDSSQAGAAWVLIRRGGTWTQQAKLVGTGAVGVAQQGTSVALSADGNTAIVGGPGDNGQAGAAWVFTRSGGTWTQQAKLVGGGALGIAQQGTSVSLSGDGNTAIVGGPNDDSQAGAAWVFARGGATWTQQAKLVGSGAVGIAMQGTSVALSGDDNTAIVGGPFDNSFAGAAWVFIRCPGIGGWCQQAKLVGSGAIGSVVFQGISVVLSADGNIAVSGGPVDNLNSGAAWVFVRIGGTWSQQAKLVGSGAVGSAEQGSSVALSSDGNTAILGGPNDKSQAGAAWVFTRSDGVVWNQQAKLFGSGAMGNAMQGNSVALSCNTAMVGGPADNSAAGAAWIFAAAPAASHDFNGDCRSDVVWYNTSTGQVALWLLNGVSVLGGGAPGSLASPWAIVGQRDFNGDGFADILWRNGTNGQAQIWLMDGASMIGGGSPGTVTPDWTVAGTGDFNADGFADILWYNTGTGQVVLWFLNGASVIGGGSPGTVTTDWTVGGTGDFNGDGFADILWYNTSTGKAVIWLVNGTSIIGGGSPGGAARPWTVAGTGDFNGDRSSDILWYNTSTGQAVIWLVNGMTVIGGGSPGSVASPWTIVETGDFNGDGKADILWSNTNTGQIVLWFVNGTAVIGGGSPGGATTSWQIQGMNAE
jgi:hypothetical protein